MIDFQIMEAVAVKAMKEEEKAAKQAEKNEWKKDSAGLDRLKELAG